MEEKSIIFNANPWQNSTFCIWFLMLDIFYLQYTIMISYKNTNLQFIRDFQFTNYLLYICVNIIANPHTQSSSSFQFFAHIYINSCRKSVSNSNIKECLADDLNFKQQLRSYRKQFSWNIYIILYWLFFIYIARYR